MNHYEQCETLVRLAVAHSTEVEMVQSLWSCLYEYDTSGKAPAPASIIEITHLRAVSPEGYASTDIALVGRLTSGQWVTCVAWSDTSGFDCQGQVDWWVGKTREDAIRFGLDEEPRRALGFPSIAGETR